LLYGSDDDCFSRRMVHTVTNRRPQFDAIVNS
jgi:hypothetical protein